MINTIITHGLKNNYHDYCFCLFDSFPFNFVQRTQMQHRMRAGDKRTDQWTPFVHKSSGFIMRTNFYLMFWMLLLIHFYLKHLSFSLSSLLSFSLLSYRNILPYTYNRHSFLVLLKESPYKTFVASRRNSHVRCCSYSCCNKFILLR